MLFYRTLICLVFLSLGLAELWEVLVYLHS